MHHFLLAAVIVALLGVAQAANLPIITLPWGKYQAEVYQKDEKIYLFKNIRFGIVPERFGPPYSPWELSDKLQDSNINTTCYQIDPKGAKNPPGGKNPLGDPGTPFESQTEDCLFLDVYVPKWVFEQPPEEPLPVVNWIFGGGYAFGTKGGGGGPLYSGQALLSHTTYSTIFVAANYRVGAFGWLAGDYIQNVGQPNAGLYDQALALEWIQDYIGQVHGNPEDVSAWGESAGAGSILHHLIREDGTRAPLFKKFVAQSPGYEWAWDNSPNGKLDTIYRNFSSLAGCGFEYDIDCLRGANPTDLGHANQALYDLVRQTGLFPVGPAVDGRWITMLSPIAFRQKRYWPDIESAIVTHVANEGYLFAPDDMNAEKYNQFLNEFLPGENLAFARELVKSQYDCSKYLTYKICVANIIAHAVFVCNARTLIDTYPSYALEYQYPADGLSFHGTDLIPEFINNYEEALTLLLAMDISPLVAPGYAKGLDVYIKDKFQTYYGAHALTGDPNSLQYPGAVHWPPADASGDLVGNVLQVRLPDLFNPKAFQLINDTISTKTHCVFWDHLAEIIWTMRDYGSSADAEL